MCPRKGVFSSQTSEISEVRMVAPNLMGENYSVVSKLSTTSIDYEVISSRYVFSDQIPEGYIISQTPKAGETMIKGGTIAVEISQGPYKRVLPNVAGMSYEQAEKQLKVLKVLRFLIFINHGYLRIRLCDWLSGLT